MDRCRIAENTLWAVLNSLEAQKLIARQKGKRNSNVYQLYIPAVTANETVTQVVESPQTERHQSPQTTGLRSPQSERYQYPQKERHEVIPLKDSHRTIPSEGGLTHWLNDDEAERLADDLGANATAIRTAAASFERHKANWPNDPRTPDALLSWLTTSTAGKAAWLEIAPAAPRPNTIPEPENVVERVRMRAPHLVHLVEGRKWAVIATHTQEAILRALASDRGRASFA
jgi:hypothetical protein